MAYTFIVSKEMKIDILPEQEKELCSKEIIKKACVKRGVIAFDVFLEGKLIGFAMFSKWKGIHFLWNYAIDKNYQNQGHGERVLKELFEFMKSNYKASKITTTYIWGNEHAKHIYEKVGFVETDVVEEDGVHEVNMIINL